MTAPEPPAVGSDRTAVRDDEVTWLPAAEERRGRLAWWRPDELDAERRSLSETIVGGPRASGPQAFPLADAKGRLEGPFNALLVDPAVGAAVQSVGAALRFASALSDREREVAVLELAFHRRCDFERYAHARVGRALGLLEDELEALRTGDPCPSLAPGERAARRVTAQLCTARDLDDETFRDATDVLGEVKLADLVVLVGYYELLALVLATWRTPLPAGAGDPWSAEPERDETVKA